MTGPFVFVLLACGILSLLLAGALLIALSFTEEPESSVLSDEHAAIDASEETTCILEPKPSIDPVCMQKNGRCLVSSACYEGGVPTDTACCVEVEILRFCACPVDLQVNAARWRGTASIVTEPIANLTANSSDLCREILRNDTFTRLRTASSGGGNWSCGLEPEHRQPFNTSFRCPADIVPRSSVSCLLGADGTLRIGTRAQLTADVEGAELAVSDYHQSMRHGGLAMLIVALLAVLAFGLKFVYDKRKSEERSRLPLQPLPCAPILHEQKARRAPPAQYVGNASEFRDVTPSIADKRSKARPETLQRCSRCNGTGQCGLFGPVGLGIVLRPCDACFGHAPLAKSQV